MKNILSGVNTRTGIMLFVLLFFWIKCLYAYFGIFNLRGANFQTIFLTIINPIGFTLTLFTLLLFIRPKVVYYISLLVLTFLANLLLYMNVLYYREFTDFLTIDTMTGGAGMFQHGFDFGSIPVQAIDLIFWVDLIVILVLVFMKKIKLDARVLPPKRTFVHVSIALMVFALNFMMADMNQHQLILRRAQSDKTYIVRSLGLGPWLLTDSYYTHLANSQRANAKPQTLTEIQDYVKSNRYLAPNADVFGIAKNKNVIILHLESFQQFLIDYRINGQEVTPFINSIYHSNETYAFSNFFNQVGQGKTSDAENMLETSTFGLPAGSLFAKLGSTQDFQAMPALLDQTNGYSSAVFHGNVGAFYNRLNTYKQMGYQNFFDQSYFDAAPTNMTAWGVLDKVFFRDSIPMLEQLQQPFYVKYLTVSNHLTYLLDDKDKDPNFQTTSSGNQLVDDYFVTAHYLDQAIHQFYDYLKASGLYNKSIIVLYGDHYGISGSDNKSLAPLLGVDPTNYNDFYNAMWQRTPFMVDIPGETTGHVIDKYTGEIDVMPTLEHLLGLSTENYIQFGQDVLSNDHQNFVALRNGGFIAPDITLPSLNAKTAYDTKTAQPITTPSPEQKERIDNLKATVSKMLKMSDTLNNQNLLRFYTPSGFTPVNPKNFDYTEKNAMARLSKQEKDLGAKSTSLLSQNNNKSTLSLYTTDIPEVKNGSDIPKE